MMKVFSMLMTANNKIGEKKTILSFNFNLEIEVL